MAYEVVWLPAAEEDLRAIAEYIAADSKLYAASVVRNLLDSAADLHLFPLMGRSVPEWHDPQLRERIVFSYRLIYRVVPASSTIQILAVLHGARLLPSDLKFRAPTADEEPPPPSRPG